MMKNSIDPSNELDSADFDGCDIEFTADINDLKEVQFFIVAVPTPIDEGICQTLRLIGASKTVEAY